MKNKLKLVLLLTTAFLSGGNVYAGSCAVCLPSTEQCPPAASPSCNTSNCSAQGTGSTAQPSSSTCEAASSGSCTSSTASCGQTKAAICRQDTVDGVQGPCRMDGTLLSAGQSVPKCN